MAVIKKKTIAAKETKEEVKEVVKKPLVSKKKKEEVKAAEEPVIPKDKDLVDKAKENTRVVVKEGSKAEEKVIKEGNIENKIENKRDLDSTIVGLSKGITKNMGNYQTLRIDCWLATPVEKGKTVGETLENISEILDTVLADEVEKLTD